MFVLGYFTYAFYHFTVIYYAVNEDGWRFVVFWWLGLFAWFCLVNFLGEYIVTVVCFCLGHLNRGVVSCGVFYVLYVVLVASHYC